VRYRFISENRHLHSVERMCKCIKVSANAYYNWMNNDFTQNKKTDLLKNRIQEIFDDSNQVYGSAKIQKSLGREGLVYSRSYVSVLMKQMGIRSVLKRKFTITTDSNHSYPLAKNELNRDFSSSNLGEKWVSDITYIRVNDDWNYLTTIMDLADRKIVGWSLSEDMTTENTVFKAWKSAINTRGIQDNFIFHSDRGVQYASNKMSSIFSFNRKITQSMSRKGNCWDNAVAESFFKTIKYECLLRYKFKSYEQLYSCINEYLIWYNTKRLHSSLGYLTPLEKEMELRNFIKNVA
jgi:putative transposase